VTVVFYQKLDKRDCCLVLVLIYGNGGCAGKRVKLCGNCHRQFSKHF
jgi:hypothetical protein